jgi:hypothetical protein
MKFIASLNWNYLPLAQKGQIILKSLGQTELQRETDRELVKPEWSREANLHWDPI